MPSTELDAMLANVSNQMAHAQLLRRLSGNSNSNSMTGRRRSAKILKANSVGNSPHNCNVQRRKTTTSQPTGPNHSVAQERYQARGQRLGNSYTSWRQAAQGRPVSWHPGSREHEMAAMNVFTGEPTMRNTIAGLETLAVAEDPVPLSHPFAEGNMTTHANQPFQENDVKLHSQYCVNGGPEMFDQPLANAEGYQQLMTGNDMVFPSYPSYGVPDIAQTANPLLPYGYTYDQYALSGLQASDWAHLSSNIDDYPIPQTPDFLPIQYPANDLDGTDLVQITKKKSKELVGMGLYDNTDRDVLSSLNVGHGQGPNHSANLQRESMGKGLQLEETWQPPKEDEGDDEDEEEASSADEAEEYVPVSFAQDDTQPSFYPTYNDLSNQTFFFDNDDQYTNCIAFDQTMPLCQPKAPDPVLENSLWF